jgi:hypothetical protein
MGLCFPRNSTRHACGNALSGSGAPGVGAALGRLVGFGGFMAA